MKLTDLEKRILEISVKKRQSHIGSCLGSVNIIDSIYQTKDEKDVFILSSGHAALAWYVVLEKYLGVNAEELLNKHGVHPNRDLENGLTYSAGSLGHGIGAALGMALADKDRLIYVLVSDGELAEGSCWETISLAAELEVDNLVILVNANGYSAYKELDLDRLEWKLASFVKGQYPKVSFIRTEQKVLKGLAAHYKVMSPEELEDL